MQMFAPFMVKRRHAFAWILALMVCVLSMTVLLAQTAFAQNTYVITDGEQVTVHTSFASDPAKVLDEVGVELDVDDFYTTAAGDGVSEITVQRGQVVYVDYCGETLELNTYGETLGALLDRSGIQTYGQYTVSQPLQTMTYDGMQVQVGNVVKSQETYTVELPYETIYCDDPSLPQGQEQVVVAGSAGQLLCSAEVVYVNAQEQSRIVTEETVLQRPVDQIVAVGVGAQAEPQEEESELWIGDGIIRLPTGEVLTYTDSATYNATAYTHLDEGCDMVTATGTRVKWGTVAVDPRMIPYGTRMFIVTSDGSFIYGIATAEDCGGAIKGNRIDLYMPTLSEAFRFGRRSCTVYFLGESEW